MGEVDIPVPERIVVLLVDDEPDFLEMAREFLEQEDDRLIVEAAHSSREALRLLEGRDFDAVVSDYQMPEMDGLELLREIRERSDLPFIMFTGKGREEVAMKALNLGANRYLRKGGDPSSQFGVLSRAIAHEVRYWWAERKLRVSEEKYRDLTERSLVGVYIIQEGVFRYVNPEFCRIFGYSREDLIGRDFSGLVDPEDRSMVQEGVALREKGEGEPTRYSFRALDSSGDRIWVQVFSVPSNFDGRPAVQGTLLDITRQRENELEVTRQREELTAIYNNLPVIIFLVDRERRVRKINSMGLEFAGETEENIIMKRGGEALRCMHHLDDPEGCGFGPHCEDCVVRRAVMDTFDREEGLFREKAVLPFKMGDRVRDLTLWVSTAYLELEGEARVLVCIEDITELESARRSQEFLLSLYRHEFSNRLPTARGFLDLLDREADLGEARKHLLRASTSLQDGIDLIEKTREFDRVQIDEVREVDLVPIIRDAVEANRHLAEEKGSDVQVESPEVRVMGGDLLEEALSNLLENAIRHSGGGAIRVSVDTSGEDVLCSVEDDGQGVPEDMMEWIMERGVSSGSSGGTGLGLFLTRMVVEHYRGTIEVKDSEMGGAKFEIRLIRP
ncbi:MAG: PAS domain S-box protein [Methanomassiliicoccales archaeon]